jgi:hypothetical protein
MRYLCLIYGSDEQFAAQSKVEADAMVDGHLAYDNRLHGRGQFIVAEPLRGPETATVRDLLEDRRSDREAGGR